MKLSDVDSKRGRIVFTAQATALAAAVTTGMASTPALAAFDATVNPPRFELSGKPGEVIRQVVTITNGATQPARFRVKTADWELDAAGKVKYDEGAPGDSSCRPWVRIERHQLNVGAKDARSYRFEVHIPANAKSGECRFAFLVASEAGHITQPGPSQIQIPVVGRLGVIVYVVVGDAKPKLEVVEVLTRKLDGKTVPVATVINRGTAHGRVFGSLEARDAKGRKLELIAEQAAILPQATRAILLDPVDWSSGEPRTPAFDLVPPLHVRGKLQFLDGGEIGIDQVIR